MDENYFITCRDEQFVLVDANSNEFLPRNYPLLPRVSFTLTGRILGLSAPGMPAISALLGAEEGDLFLQVGPCVYRNMSVVAGWLSQVLDRECKLLHVVRGDKVSQ